MSSTGRRSPASTPRATGARWPMAALPSQVSYAVAPMQNTVQTIGLMNQVSFQAQWRGRSLEGRRAGAAHRRAALSAQDDRGALDARRLHAADGPARASRSPRRRRGGTVAAATYWVKVTAKNAQGETTRLERRRRSSPPARPRPSRSRIFTVPNATQYNVYIGSGATLPADVGDVAPGGPLRRERRAARRRRERHALRRR